jgi:hypothetical protein
MVPDEHSFKNMLNPDFDTHIMNTDPEVVLVYIAIHKNTIFIVINIVCIFCNEVSMIYKEKKLII